MDTIIEAFGSTSLLEAGNQFVLSDGDSGGGPVLKKDGTAVTGGQFAGWTPIGAEQTASGYQVIWKKGANQYTVWTVDGGGNFLSASGAMLGTSPVLQALEPVFHQDLNGDGFAAGAVIEAFGSTSLLKAGNQFVLFDGVSGQVLKKDGAAVVAGQFAGWTPIGVEQTSSGYQVVWKKAKSGQYTVWTVDGSGNFLSTSDAMVGVSPMLQALEPVFHQDLNGDGVSAGAVIEAFGSTSLLKAGNEFVLFDGGGGPVLKKDGTAVVEGQFRGWSAIGVEQTASGYQVIWKKGANQYTVWTVDSSGNFLSASGAMSGTSPVLQALEPVFHQDLNGDGFAAGAVIEAFGSTSLLKAGNQFVLFDGASGQVLMKDGSAVVAGQFAGWTPIGVEQTPSGYQVIWKKGANQYTVWTVDGGGNYLSATATLPGTSSVLKALEPGFHQDLNGDGKIGNTPTFAGLSTTASTISFIATDLDGGSLGLSGPFDAALGAVANGALTTLTPVAQAMALSGALQITDGANVADVMGLYLGTDGNDTATAPAPGLPNALFGFGGDDTLTGGPTADSISGGAGDDTIVGSPNDVLLDGGADDDTLLVDPLLVGEAFISTSDAQIANIENVVLAGAVTLNLSKQTEGFAITGSSGDDTIVGGSGADSIDGGADYDTLVGRGGADTLSGGVDSDSFAYLAQSDSTHAAYDTILDFTHGEDFLEFRGLGEFWPLVTVTTAPLTIAAHTIEAFVSGGNTIVYVNTTDGDLAADQASMEIHLIGVTDLTDGDIYVTDGGPNAGFVSASAASVDFFFANDVDGRSFVVTGPFESVFGDTVVIDGVTTTFTPVAQTSALSGLLQLSDGTNAYDIIGLFLGTEGDDVATGPYRPSSAYLWNALYGFGGDDTLTTGAEGELLVGGTGNDTYYIDYYSSYVIEQAGEGTDTVYTSKEFVLAYGSEVEVVRVYDTTEGVSLFGNELDNTLIGGVGGDWLGGGFGADSLSGGAGGDTFSYGSEWDSTHAEHDTILDFVVGQDRLNFAELGTFAPLVTVTTAPTTIAAHTIEAFVSGGSTILYVNNTNGALATDSVTLEIHLAGVTGLTDADISVFNSDETDNAPVVADVLATAAYVSFVAADPEHRAMQLLVSGSVLDQPVNSGSTTELEAIVGAVEVSGVLQVSDRVNVVDVMGVYFGTAGDDLLTGTILVLPQAVYGFGGDDTLGGGAGADWLFGGEGNDTIYGAQNDALLDGGGGDSNILLVVDTEFVSTSDAQIANIQKVTLASATTLDLSNQTEEGFEIRGSSDADSITGGAGNDTIYGAQNDTLLDGGGGARNVLWVGTEFISTSDAQIANIHLVALASAGTVDLSNQTEGFEVGGPSGTSSIIGSAGNDTIYGNQSDILLDGSDGAADTLLLGIFDANFTSSSDGQIANIERIQFLNSIGLDLSNQTEGFTIDGAAGNDTIIGGSGADWISASDGYDVIWGSQNDTLLDGGNGDFDELRVSADFVSTSDSQIVSIEQVTLTQAVTLDLSNQYEAFTIFGSAGADVVIGGFSADSIGGGDGDDTIFGEENDAWLDGGADTDTLRVGVNFTSTHDNQITDIERVLLSQASLLDLASQSDGFTITGSSGNDGITGSSGSDSITGGAGADSISAGAHNDTIVGADDDTLLDGGADADTLEVAADFTSTGDAQIVNVESVVLTSAGILNLSNQSEGFAITGSSGDDTITGGSGEDSILAGAGNDTIFGAQNDTLLDGGDGVNLLWVEEGFVGLSDQIVNIQTVALLSAGTLNLSSQLEDLEALGTSGDDVIHGGYGADSIRAGAGNDTIYGSPNDTLLDGGADIDVLQISQDFAPADDSQLTNIEQVDLLRGTMLDLSNQTEGFTVTGSDEIDSIVGGAGDDTIVGRHSDILLNGGGGTDTLQVAGSFTSVDDAQLVNIERVLLASSTGLNLSNQTEGFTILGSTEIDYISGGAGDDTIVGAQNDAWLQGNGGTDTLLIGADFTSAYNEQITGIENVVLTAAVQLNLTNQTEGFNITGSAGFDVIDGSSGDDTIRGVSGGERVNGGDGTDTLLVDADFTSVHDGLIYNLEKVNLTTAVTLDLSIQTEGFAITGSSGADNITGGSGNDAIFGAANDTLLDGRGGTDTLQVGANFTSTSDAQIVGIENVVLTQALILDLSNQTEGFKITGSSAADSITGGSGNDTIVGVQNDALLGGGGGIDTLQIDANFTSTGDVQIANIENVLLTQAVALDLSNQIEGFTITGSSDVDSIVGGSGADSISAGAGNDTIFGVQNDTLLDGGADTDTLQVGADLTSTGDAQIARIENVVLTAALTLNLSNQTEGFTISGSSGDDGITGGSGVDSISGGAGDDMIGGGQGDTLLDGGADDDTLRVGANFTSTGDGQIVDIENVLLSQSATLDLSNQTEDFTITGSAGDDSLTGGSGADSIGAGSGTDTIFGMQNDALLDGGADDDTLRVGVNFTSTGDSQIDNIEKVLLAQALTLNLSNQTEGFTITGSSGSDSITGGSGADSIGAGAGNDTIFGAQEDTLLDGGANVDTLQVGANFISTGNGQIANIENVVLAAALTLNLSNQTEGFTITGSSGSDSITGGAGNDTIVGAVDDALLDGGAGSADLLQLAADFSTDDAQLANIERLLLTAVATLDLSSQTEGFTITGSSGADSITGGSGNDTIVGAENDTLLSGGGGTDMLRVGASFTSSNDGHLTGIEQVLLASTAALDLSNQTEAFTITGSSGADTITGGSAADSISAGAGNDTIFGAQNDALLDGGADNDTLQIGLAFTSTSDAQIAGVENVLLAEAVTLDLSSQTEGFTITGSSGVDTITGGSGADSISAGGGNDTILGAQGDTLLDGGSDTDTLKVAASFTSTGNAQIANVENVLLTSALTLNLSNQTEGFTITGSSGSDSITGGAGNDTIVGAVGDSLLDGGAGSADLLQLAANFTSTGDAQLANIEQVLLTTAATLNLSNQTEGFTITGSSGADIITGGAGNDIIVGAVDDTLLDGGGATDTLQIGAAFTSTGDGQVVDVENVVLTGAAVLNLSNQTEDFTITGSSGADSITGGAGNDTILGAQNDLLLSGGGGTDTLQIGAAFINVINSRIIGIERVAMTAATTLSLASQFEAFTITGSSGADNITGGASADTIRAGAGNDSITGESNDALLDGGEGTDTLQLIFAAFTSSSDAQLVDIEQVAMTASTETVNLANQSEGFTFTGSAAADIIIGGSGADSISAGGGNDTIGGTQNDTLLDGGGDTDTLQVGADFTSTGNAQIVNIEQVLLTQAVTLDLSNQSESFKITGSSGADIIAAGSGNDTLEGRAGNDALSGGSGNDTFVFAAVADSTTISFDTIADFTHGADHIDFASIGGIDFVQGSTGGGNIDAHSIAWTESGGNTLVYVNTSGASEAAGVAQMQIVLTGINLGLTANDFLFV